MASRLLIFRLMDLKTFASQLSPAERADFVERAGTNLAYLSQLVNGHRRAGPSLARRLRAASGDVIELESLRPDLWAESP